VDHARDSFRQVEDTDWSFSTRLVSKMLVETPSSLISHWTGSWTAAFFRALFRLKKPPEHGFRG